MSELSDLEYLVGICEPLRYSHWPTYRDACNHAVGGITWVDVEPGETVVDAYTRLMAKAVESRNDYYRARVNDWRVVHG